MSTTLASVSYYYSIICRYACILPFVLTLPFAVVQQKVLHVFWKFEKWWPLQRFESRTLCQLMPISIIIVSIPVWYRTMYSRHTLSQDITVHILATSITSNHKIIWAFLSLHLNLNLKSDHSAGKKNITQMQIMSFRSHFSQIPHRKMMFLLPFKTIQWVQMESGALCVLFSALIISEKA